MLEQPDSLAAGACESERLVAEADAAELATCPHIPYDSINVLIHTVPFSAVGIPDCDTTSSAVLSVTTPDYLAAGDRVLYLKRYDIEHDIRD